MWCGLPLITTEYAVGNNTDPGKYATMKHCVKSVTCRIKRLWAIKSVDDEKGEVTGRLPGLNVERAKDRIFPRCADRAWHKAYPRADKGKEGWISCDPGFCDTDGWRDGGSSEYRDTSGVWRDHGRCGRESVL